MNRNTFLSAVALFLLAVSSSLYASSQSFGISTSIIKSHAIAMHGEPKYAADFSGFEYTSPTAKKGGTLKLHSEGTFDSLNGFIPKGNAADKLGLIYDSLTVGAADEPFTQYGLLAQWIEYPNDRSWVVFHLRPEARFHDGKPITAHDMVFTFNLLMEKGDPSYKFYYGGVSKVQALTDHQVKFSFSDLSNKELPLVVGQLPVLPKHFWENPENFFDKSSLEKPLGSGAYKIGKVDAGRSIEYERVENYWAKDLPVMRGLYNFNTIQVDYYRDSNIALEAIKAGEYDYRWENSSKSWAVGYDVPAVNEGVLKREQVKHSATNGMQAFAFNIRNPLFKERTVRQAIAYAFDFEWSNNALFYGAYQRNDSFFDNSELAAEGLPFGRELEILEKYRNQLPADIFTTPIKMPVADGSGNNRPNLRLAKKLLDEAGYKVVDNRLMTPTGQPFEFEIMLISQQFERIVNPFIRNLKKLGIGVSVRLIDTSQYINRIRNFEFDMTVKVFPQSQSPGNEQKEFWGSDAADTDASRNIIGIKNPVIDELVDQISQTESREELVAYTRALDRVLLNNHYVVPNWMKPSSNLVFWDKFGRPEIAPKYDKYYSTGIMTWWYEPEKAKAIKQWQEGSN